MANQATQRLQELQQAASEYFSSEKQRLNAEYNFLDAISKKRGGTIGLQDINAAGASNIMVDSINEYLGRPNAPVDEP
jgi:hypothetical protein